MNSVQLIGNLTRDPDRRELPSGGDVSTLRIAVDGRRRGPNGTWTPNPSYFDVVTFGRLAITCAEHLRRGARIAVTGRLEHREWDTDTGRRSTVEIVASEVDFLPSPERAEAGAEPATV